MQSLGGDLFPAVGADGGGNRAHDKAERTPRTTDARGGNLGRWRRWRRRARLLHSGMNPGCTGRPARRGGWRGRSSRPGRRSLHLVHSSTPGAREPTGTANRDIGTAGAAFHSHVLNLSPLPPTPPWSPLSPPPRRYCGGTRLPFPRLRGCHQRVSQSRVAWQSAARCSRRR